MSWTSAIVNAFNLFTELPETLVAYTYDSHTAIQVGPLKAVL
jgi:hypothetical protein